MYDYRDILIPILSFEFESKFPLEKI